MIPEMTLRDYFAAKVLQALLSSPPWQSIEINVQDAYEYADAMLAERHKSASVKENLK